jgi:hypothetical protein
MNLLTPNLSRVPAARVIVNSLYDCKQAGFLTQDLLLVELPGRTFIDVSWFPEHDPAGAYTVTVFRGHNQIHDVETKSAYEAVSLVENLANAFSTAVGNVSCSRGQTVDYRPAA